MATGFRKSLFGFHCDDVLEYIEKTHKSFQKKENEWNEQIADLNNELNDAKSAMAEISQEKDMISQELTAFKERASEIERLSENIGKLYLVAQANAKAIMENSENNAQLSAEETKKNISSIDEAHSSLSMLEEELLKTSQSFSEDIQKLMASLNRAKAQILENNQAIVEKSNDFNEFLASITK